MKWRQEKWLWVLVVLGLVMYGWNLGGQGLSLDEAETLVLSRSLHEHPWYVSPWDGKNLVSITGKDSTQIGEALVWQWHPWLQHYVTALVLLLNDLNHLTRVPFVLVGVAGVGVVYLLAFKLWKRKDVAFLLGLGLLVNVPHFLYLRQIRYYSLVSTLGLVVLWGLVGVIQKSKILPSSQLRRAGKNQKHNLKLKKKRHFDWSKVEWRNLLQRAKKRDFSFRQVQGKLLGMTKHTPQDHQAGSMVSRGVMRQVLSKLFEMMRSWEFVFGMVGLLLFFSNYLAFLTSWMVVMGVATVLKNKRLVVLGLIQLVIVGMWFVALKPFGGDVLYMSEMARGFLSSSFTNLRYINNWILPLVLVPVLVWLGRKDRVFWLMGVWVGVKLLVYSVFLVPHGRYLVELVPVLVLMGGWLLVELSKKGKICLVTGWVVVFGWYGLHKLPMQLLRVEVDDWSSPIQVFAKEWQGKYENGVEELGQFLAANSDERDYFWSNAYGLDLYWYSGVARVPANCEGGKFVLPSGEINVDDVRWWVFFVYDDRWKQEFEEVGCGLEKLDWENDYVKREFFDKKGFYRPNNTDIENRSFPPVEAGRRDVVVWEKKADSD